MHHRLYILIMCTLLLTAMSLASCSVDDAPDKQFDMSYNAQSGTPYSGKWEVSGKSIDKILMNQLGTTFMFGAIPTMQIEKAIFAGHAIEGVSTGAQSVAYESVQQSDGTIVYAIKPSVWQIEVQTDGKRHNVQLMLGPTDASTDQQSWGKYTPKTRVLTVFLHITAYAIDNGDTHPLQLKLTYTGTPITDC